MNESIALHEFPIRLGAPKEFAEVRRYFRDIGFDEDTVNSVLPVDDAGKFEPEKWNETKVATVPARLRLPIEVFVRGESVPAREFRAVCDDKALSALHALGLLRPSTTQPDQFVSPVWLYPLDGFIIASDRYEDADGGSFVTPADVIYTGLNPLTLRFLRMLPDARGGDALDLCGGCGIGALRLSRTARAAASADITARSAFFTDFNGRLNGVEIASLCGDLYEPAGNRQFDIITAHPPFVPALGAMRLVFRDADEFGEAITRQIIAGLPARLRIGGTSVIVCAAWDTDKPIERRAREWLGEAAPFFDVVFGQFTAFSIERVCDGIRTIQKDVPEDEIQQFEKNLRAWGAKQRVYGALVFRRCAEPVTHPPLRIHLAEETVGADLQRLLDWRQARRTADFGQRIANTKPLLSPQLEVNARYVVRDGELAAADFVFQTADGLLTKVRPDIWIAPWVMRFDGKRTVADIFTAAQTANAVPQEFTLAQFVDFVGLMAERGFLDFERPL